MSVTEAEVQQRLDRIRSAAIVVASRSRLLLAEWEVMGRLPGTPLFELWRDSVKAYDAVLDAELG